VFFAPLVSEDVAGWIEDSFYWSIENGLLHADTPLISSSHANFPVGRGAPRDVAKGIVLAIQGHLGILEERIDVEPLDVLPAEYRLDYNAMSDIGGTWQSDDGHALIRFDPEQLQRPVAFLSTMIHEVMHHRLHMTLLDMPGGPEAEELSTDLHCITTGFGLIQMQGAEAAGWQGYMRQESRAYALAMFLAVTDHDSMDALGQLPARSARLVKKAAKMIAQRRDDVAALQDALHTAPC